MNEKTSTPKDSIHNLNVAIEAMRAEGLDDHVSLVEDGIWQIEQLVRQVEDARAALKTAEVRLEAALDCDDFVSGHNALPILEIIRAALTSTEDNRG